MQFDLLCTDTKLSLARPLDSFSLIAMKTWLSIEHFLLSVEMWLVAYLEINHIRCTRHKSRINQISSAIDQSISPPETPPAVRALLIKFQPPRFTFSPQFGILPTVSDSTHRSLWFATLFPSSPLLPPNVTGICTDFPFLQLLPRLFYYHANSRRCWNSSHFYPFYSSHFCSLSVSSRKCHCYGYGS